MTVAASLALAWSSFLGLLGLVVLVVLPPVMREMQSGYCENWDHPGRCSGLRDVLLPGLVLLAVGTWSVLASVGLLRRRQWARWGVVVTFSLQAIVPMVGLVGSLTSASGLEVAGAVAAFGFLGFFATIVVLAMQPD